MEKVNPRRVPVWRFHRSFPDSSCCGVDAIGMRSQRSLGFQSRLARDAEAKARTGQCSAKIVTPLASRRCLDARHRQHAARQNYSQDAANAVPVRSARDRQKGEAGAPQEDARQSGEAGRGRDSCAAHVKRVEVVRVLHGAKGTRCYYRKRRIRCGGLGQVEIVSAAFIRCVSEVTKLAHEPSNPAAIFTHRPSTATLK